MQWKANARRISGKCVAERLASDSTEVMDSPEEKPFLTVNGKPFVNRDHRRDYVEDGEVIATIEFKTGEYLFPSAYIHPEKGLFGETRDIRMTDKGWAVYLDAVLRDKGGKPILFNGQEIDRSGWYLESALKDAGIGMETIRPGSTAPSIAEMAQSRARRMRANATAGI